MQTIMSHDALFALLFERLLKSEPQAEVSAKLVDIGKEVASEFADVGFFVRYDAACWQDTFADILGGLAQPRERVRCGQMLLPFLVTLYARIAADPEKLSVEDAGAVLRDVLKLDRSYLRSETIGERRFLIASKKFREEFGVDVKIRQSDEERELPDEKVYYLAS